ncbi:MAG: hypothetical protein EB141_15050 [Verrucomicrobia bacterium]|nr:hypothetical protein [Verrucomicrobiota bacterium]NBU11837.1 hypothetical protein [Pseudomonadota bacterium]NDA67443.1 hypothetical protein [Verrucomicrobiota bacterium]NDB76933.1 hypothetical protein [Verrucomicrobiota bacterium]NDD39739.1 hypothetical protein [Verrucomicrobiota bacterium]
MTIEKHIEIQHTVSVSISCEDIAEAIAEDPESSHSVLRGINNCGAFLKAVPNARIAALNTAQRETIRHFLQQQAARF